MSSHADSVKPSRRDFLFTSAAAAIGAAQATSAQSTSAQSASTQAAAGAQRRQPNIILYIADQVRADFLGVNGNTTAHTPNLDGIARRGTNFRTAVTNQPVCSPSRSILLTGRYATETGVWKNARAINPELPTLAGELRKAGYTANMIGKWHLAPNEEAQGGGRGFVRPEYRAGFDDLWEGANEFEWTTHPYEGTIWDAQGKEIKFSGENRIEFITDRAVRFLEQNHAQKQEKPFLLYISQLEPHQQNDANRMIAPKGYADRFRNPYVPQDLRSFPGNWQTELPDYYGSIAAIDDSVGRVLKTLEQQGQLDNTIFIFTSDHGCHFMTRNAEYKRSPHNASIRIPLVVQGPGFNTGEQVPQVIGNINLMPTLLEAAGVPVPASVKGKSVLPMLTDAKAREQWHNAELIQISESMTGRAIRTPEWCYCAVDREPKATQKQGATVYDEYQMYDEGADPYELTNLAGRKEYRAKADELAAHLKQLIVAAGEPEPQIRPTTLYP